MSWSVFTPDFLSSYFWLITYQLVTVIVGHGKDKSIMIYATCKRDLKRKKNMNAPLKIKFISLSKLNFVFLSLDHLKEIDSSTIHSYINSFKMNEIRIMNPRLLCWSTYDVKCVFITRKIQEFIAHKFLIFCNRSKKRIPTREKIFCSVQTRFIMFLSSLLFQELVEQNYNSNLQM